LAGKSSTLSLHTRGSYPKLNHRSLTPHPSTGRAGQDGRAITFFGEAEKHLAGALVNVLKAAGQPVPEELMKYGTTVKKKGHEAYGAFYKDTEGMKAATKITFD
jgi:ATP-dependent RNA helicase DBP3